MAATVANMTCKLIPNPPSNPNDNTDPSYFVGPNSCIFNNKLYTIIRFVSDDSATAGNYSFYLASYDKYTNLWSIINKLPIGNRMFYYDLIIYNNAIHLIGNCRAIDGYDDSRLFYKLNNNNEWERLPDLPYFANEGCSAIVYHDELHLMGSSSTNNNKAHYAWNGTSWRNVAILPYSFSNHSALIYDDKIYLFFCNFTGSGQAYLKNIKTLYYDGSSWQTINFTNSVVVSTNPSITMYNVVVSVSPYIKSFICQNKIWLTNSKFGIDDSYYLSSPTSPPKVLESDKIKIESMYSFSANGCINVYDDELFIQYSGYKVSSNIISQRFGKLYNVYANPNCFKVENSFDFQVLG